jgi:1-acyl-sn-glycerol-3-phosphate acyltransferase
VNKTSKDVSQSNGWLQTALKLPILLLIKLVYRPRVTGGKNIPKDGAVVIASNHKHTFDPFLIMSGRPLRKMHFLAKKELRDWPIGRLIGYFGVIFVDREATDKTDAKSAVHQFLDKKRVVAVTPEGTRNKTDKVLKPFKYGAVSFAQKSGAPLVPAAIIGEYRPFKKGPRVVFAPPIKVAPDEDLESANKRLYDTIERLLVDGGEKQHRANIYKKLQERNDKK